MNLTIVAIDLDIYSSVCVGQQSGEPLSCQPNRVTVLDFFFQVLEKILPGHFFFFDIPIPSYAILDYLDKLVVCVEYEPRVEALPLT